MTNAFHHHDPDALHHLGAQRHNNSFLVEGAPYDEVCHLSLVFYGFLRANDYLPTAI